MPKTYSIDGGLRRFGESNYRRTMLIVEAAVWLVVARLALIFVAFNRLAPYLGTFVPASDPRAQERGDQVSDFDSRRAEDVGLAVAWSAARVPFKAVCLPQAMAARFMLRRRGISSSLFFGTVIVSGTSMETHAWLHAGGVKVTGYPVAKRFTPIGCFV
jgi:hypothetical protein